MWQQPETLHNLLLELVDVLCYDSDLNDDTSDVPIRKLARSFLKASLKGSTPEATPNAHNIF